MIALLLPTSPSTGLALIIHVPADYETISAALENAPDDAIVELAEGVYRESLVIERPLTLRSKEGDTVLLSGSDDEPVIQISDTENVTHRGPDHQRRQVRHIRDAQPKHHDSK